MYLKQTGGRTMDTHALIDSLQTSLGGHLPTLLGALAILALGWLFAVIVRAATRRGLAALRVNERLSHSLDRRVEVEQAVAVSLFWLVLFFTLLTVLNVLDLQAASAPLALLVSQFTGYLPHLLAGLIVTLLAWTLASVLRAVVNKALAATRIDDKLAEQAGMEAMSRSVANVLFWLVILLFLPAILSAFQLRGLLEPVQGMVDRVLGMLPDIVAAAVIGFVGWLVATILRGLVVNLLAAAGADGLGQRLGLAASVSLSRLAGTLVFILVFVPSLIAALDALRISAISQPATVMLQRFFDAVPNIVAAALILVVTWYVSRFASQLLARLLAGIGFDLLPGKLGAGHLFAGSTKPSDLVGGIAVFFAMLFATVEAANQLGFTQVRDIVSMFIAFGGDVLLGAAILVIGFWLANAAYRAIDQASGPHTTGLAGAARVAILGLVLAMGLRAMGIADDIVNLAFGLTLGAVAVAVALSFGLGGREAAGKLMEHWLSRWRKD
jgi:hypothetical protein